MIDTTSGAYSNSQENKAILFQAISQWFAQYKIDNPSFNGKLYIGIPSNTTAPNPNVIYQERYIAQANILQETSQAIRVDCLNGTTLISGLTGCWSLGRNNFYHC